MARAGSPIHFRIGPPARKGRRHSWRSGRQRPVVGATKTHGLVFETGPLPLAPFRSGQDLKHRICLSPPLDANLPRSHEIVSNVTLRRPDTWCPELRASGHQPSAQRFEGCVFETPVHELVIPPLSFAPGGSETGQRLEREPAGRVLRPCIGAMAASFPLHWFLVHASDPSSAF